MQGTGNFNSSVNWQVNGVTGGNPTVGTISPTGFYTAPNQVPSPYSVTIGAVSVADSTKSATASAIVAGTIASVSQTIVAATGGTITLPDGSSVTLAAGILPSDQSVTLSEVSYLPNQPPNPALTGVGPGLVLTFASPLQFSALPAHGSRPVNESRREQTTSAVGTSSAIQFSINTSVNNDPRLNGSVTTVAVVDQSNVNTFMQVAGQFNSSVASISGVIAQTSLAAINKVKSIAFGAVNFINSQLHVLWHLYTAPNNLALDNSNPGQPKWAKYSACPSGKTLVVVHGMDSFVEASFPINPPTGGVGIQTIKSEGNYDSVLGFDYDWTQGITASGDQLADFLSLLKSCSVNSLDIEAHSEGVPVSMAALVSSRLDAGVKVKVRRLICLAGPIMGTRAANDITILGTVFQVSSIFLPDSLVIQALADIFTKPFISDLQESPPGSGDTLDKVRTRLAAQTPGLQIIVVAGNKPVLLEQFDMSWAVSEMGTTYFDGVVPVTSALAFESGLNVLPVPPVLKVYPLPPFPYGHNGLVGDLGHAIVATDVGKQVTEPNGPPSLDVATSFPINCSPQLFCEGLPGTSFIVAGPTSLGYTKGQPVDGYELKSTGEVTSPPLFQPPFPGWSGDVSSGSLFPQATSPTLCSDAPSTNAFFAVDKTTGYASNAVMEYVLAPAPSTISLTPQSANVTLGTQQAFVAAVPSCGLSLVWAVNGKVGGDPTIGTINSNGVYAAPLVLPTSNQVTIGTAVTFATGGASGNAMVSLLNPAPTVLSVSPNVVSVGSFALAITGTGFVPTSAVSFGSIPLSTTFQSATMLTVTGVASPSQAGNVPLEVTNPMPGGGSSTPLTVSVIDTSISSSGSTGIIVGQVNGMTVDKAYVPVSNSFLVSVVNVDAASGTNAVVTKIPMPNFYVPNATAADQAAQQVIVVSSTSPDVQIIDASQDKLLATLTSPVTRTAFFSGGSCMICGVTIDPTTNTAILDTAEGYLLLDLANHKFSSTIPGTSPGENFGYNPITRIILNPTYNQGVPANLQAIRLSDNSVFTYSGTIDTAPDSAAVDFNTNIAVMPDEFTGNQLLINMGGVSFSSGAFSAPTTVFNITFPNCGFFGDPNEWTMISIESSTHTLFLATEFGDCAAVEPLPAAAVSGAPPSPPVFQWGHMPSPDGFVWDNGADPHGIAVFTSVVNGKAYGFLVRRDQAWVARIDLAGVAGAPPLSGGIKGQVDLVPYVVFLRTQ